jgi:zinc transport system substrate-binding protein
VLGRQRVLGVGKSRSRFLLLATLVLLVMASGCQSSRESQQSESQATPTTKSLADKTRKTKVVTTMLPMYLFTKAVTGDVADVEILVPPGTDVHEYQATPENVKAIATADILVKNGLGLEEFLTQTVKNAQNSKLIQIDTSKGVSPINNISPVETSSQHQHDHDHSGGNPHIWLDPVIAQQQVKNIRDGLMSADPKNKATYEANAAAYIQELEKLNREYQQALKQTSNCTFITFHDAFPYIAKRYNLKQVAVVEIPEAQLSPSDIQKVVDTVKKYKVKALFNEPGVDNKLLKTLSQDLKLNLYTLDSLENGEKNPQYYFQAMRTNLQALMTGCK